MEIIVLGSKNLKIRGLLNRNNNDIDIRVDYKYDITKLIKLLKCYKIKIHIQQSFISKDSYDIVNYNNKTYKLDKLYNVLYYKYRYTKSIIKKNATKHKTDLINIFHNLGKEKSLKEINKIKQNTHLIKEDIDELIRLMEIGINNAEEI